jgi:hypothetical protein
MDLKPNAHLVRDRFGLRQGQFFHNPHKQNLWWELDGEFFGFGDLTGEDVFRIQSLLAQNEVFQGWNQHHGTGMQQTPYPQIRIRADDITYHIDLRAEAEEEDLI